MSGLERAGLESTRSKGKRKKKGRKLIKKRKLVNKIIKSRKKKISNRIKINKI